MIARIMTQGLSKSNLCISNPLHSNIIIMLVLRYCQLLLWLSLSGSFVILRKVVKNKLQQLTFIIVTRKWFQAWDIFIVNKNHFWEKKWQRKIIIITVPKVDVVRCLWYGMVVYHSYKKGHTIKPSFKIGCNNVHHSQSTFSMMCINIDPVSCYLLSSEFSTTMISVTTKF